MTKQEAIKFLNEKVSDTDRVIVVNLTQEDIAKMQETRDRLTKNIQDRKVV